MDVSFSKTLGQVVCPLSPVSEQAAASNWHKSPGWSSARYRRNYWAVISIFTAVWRSCEAAISEHCQRTQTCAKWVQTGQTTRLPLYRISGGLTEFLFSALSEWPPASLSLPACLPASVGITSWFLAASTSGTCEKQQTKKDLTASGHRAKHVQLSCCETCGWDSAGSYCYQGLWLKKRAIHTQFGLQLFYFHHWLIKSQKIVGNACHKFPSPKVTSLTMTQHTEKQQILTFDKVQLKNVWHFCLITDWND